MIRKYTITCLILSLHLFSASPCQLSASPRAIVDDAVKTTTLKIAELHAPVTIRRDGRGIPYIEASNEDDLYFAQGYVTACDRLWQMDLLRRTGRGELSEIFGRGTLEEDKLSRRYGFAVLSEAAYTNSSQSMKRALEAYARGVNALIRSLDEKTRPAEFRILKYNPSPWRPADSLIVGKILSKQLSTSWPADLMTGSLGDLSQKQLDALFPVTSILDVVLVGSDSRSRKAATASVALNQSRLGTAESGSPDPLNLVMDAMRRSEERIGLLAEGLAASNNWVVSGKHTASGKPLLANDPHLSPSAPSIWFMVHLSAPGLRVSGVTIPGAPGILIGHNESIAWGVTNLGPDVQDLFIEEFDKDNPRRYKTREGWREAEIRREEIKVRKGFADPATEVFPFVVTLTQHGPIIIERATRPYSLRWTGLDQKVNEFEGFHLINRARNWNEFCSALRKYSGAPQNFVYADISGHIGYYGAGQIPIRKSGDGSKPLDGSTGAGEWTGFIPFEKLPHLFDPSSGIIVTANNRIVGSDYPYFITRLWAHPYRARRIFDLLKAKPKLSTDDFRAIQADTYSFAGTMFAREVVKSSLEVANKRNDDLWLDVLRSFQTWDGRVNPESRVAPFVLEMRNAFHQRLLTAALGADRAKEYQMTTGGAFLEDIVLNQPKEWLPKEFNDYSDFFYACYKDARESLKKRMGDDSSQWNWGNLVKVNFQHPLAAAPFVGQQFKIAPFPQAGSVFGAGPTVNVGAAVSMRFIADVSDWDNSQQGISLGESGDPSNPHWQDQLADWRAVTPGRFPFTSAAIASVTREKLMLVPAQSVGMN